MHRVSIIIPAHNEEKRIGPTLEAYADYFRNLQKQQVIDGEILVVINNTRDSTEEIVKNIAQKNEFVKFINLKRGGKGFAVIEGFKNALQRDNDFIGFVDADMATSPNEFFKLVNALECTPLYDGVIASRYLKGSSVNPKNTLPRILASRLYNFFIRAVLLFPFRDTQCGAKLFRSGPLSACIDSLGMTKFAFDVEILYAFRRRGSIIGEIPTTWANKEHATINFWSSGPWMSLAVLRLRIIHSPFRFLVRVYDKVFNRIYRYVRKR